MQGLEKYYKFIDELGEHIKDSPSIKVETIDECDEYLRKIRSLQITFAQYYGELETKFAIHSYKTIQATSDKEYNKVKSSSTMATRFIGASNPKLFTIYKRYEIMEKTIRSSDTHFMTMISFVKEKMSIEGRFAPNNQDKPWLNIH